MPSVSPAASSREEEPQKEGNADHHCDTCSASFTRLEHLRRHETMHTKVKAFTCVFCFKDYARSDVLRRHYQPCKLARRAHNGPLIGPRRVNRACGMCRQSKLKCSGQVPCDRCTNTGQGHLCRFTLRKARQVADDEEDEDDAAANALTALATADPAENSQLITQNESSGLNIEQQDRSTTQPPMDPQLQIEEHPTQGQAQVQAQSQVQEHTQTPAQTQIQAQMQTQMQTQIQMQAQTQTQALVASRPDWMMESDDSAIEMISDQASVSAGQLQSAMTIPMVNTAMDIFNPTEFDLHPGMFLDLDLLDYGMFDTSLMMLENRGPTDSATVASFNNVSDILENTPPDRSGHRDEREGIGTQDLPKGMQLMRISPLDVHRSTLLTHLQASNLSHRRWDCWLSTDNMARYLGSYFSFFHRHTPLIHLPSWNISTTSTRLLFSMILMGALYLEDLNSQSSTDRRLCQFAQTFAWDTDTAIQSGVAQLDTIQAVYIATLLEAFYFPPKRHHARAIDIKRLLVEARKAGIFAPNRALKEPWKMQWNQWAVEESRKRTAFILYLFDTIRVIFFEQQPEMQLTELRLPLPCDESVYSAETAEEWTKLFEFARDLPKAEYPVLLALFLSHRPVQIALNLSVMGAFIVMHGILLHLWEQQSMHKHDGTTDVADEAEKSMHEHLLAAQAQVAENALQLWHVQWTQTLLRPASAESHGLHRDRALVYWFLGNLMNQPPNVDRPPDSTPLSNGAWKLKIPALLRQLAILVDSGQLDNSNGTATSIVRDKLASYLQDSSDGANNDAGGEGMDTINMRYIMRKESRSN